MDDITQEKLDRFIRQAEEADLCGKELLRSFSLAEINKICNGIGPEWMSGPLRNLIDLRYPQLVVVSMIHDLMYHLGDGTDENFHTANLFFRINGYKMADYTKGWYNPIRYAIRYDSWKLGTICDKFGKVAYNSAIQERIAGEISKATKVVTGATLSPVLP